MEEEFLVTCNECGTEFEGFFHNQANDCASTFYTMTGPYDSTLYLVAGGFGSKLIDFESWKFNNDPGLNVGDTLCDSCIKTFQESGELTLYRNELI